MRKKRRTFPRANRDPLPPKPVREPRASKVKEQRKRARCVLPFDDGFATLVAHASNGEPFEVEFIGAEEAARFMDEFHRMCQSVVTRTGAIVRTRPAPPPERKEEGD